MNWTTAKLASESIALLTVAACAVFTTAKLNTVMYNLDGAIARLEGVESKANATLVNLDAYTKTWAAASKDSDYRHSGTSHRCPRHALAGR